MVENIYEQRLECAHRYFDFLNSYKEHSWHDKLQVVHDNASAGIPELLVLLNPENYDILGLPDPRGAATFQSAHENAKCRSKELWGYSCPFKDSQIHVDHSFPRNRGGMTHPDNAMYLCREHNLSKSTDIHLIPWESMPSRNSWIRIQLNLFLASAQRKTETKLYFPDLALNRT
jgi:hypothetical protein